MPRLTADWSPAIRYLDSAVAAGAAPGAVLGVSHLGERFMHGTGQLGADEPGRPGPTTVYDLASLTKVVGLVPVAMLAIQSGTLELDAPVQRYVPAFVGEGKAAVTIRMLLAHASGLPAWRPLYREVTSREAAFALADTTPLISPPGSADLYSDLGIIVLTQALEAVYHQRFDSVLTQLVLSPLGMTSTAYLPPTSWRSRIAPTELDPWRGRVLRGEVHDENSAAMDGVSGHAGLFGSAEDLLRFAEWMIERWNDGAMERGNVVREFTRRQQIVPTSSRALGWDTPTPGSSAGTRLSPHGFGHTGFTGTSLWIDPERKLAIVLLSNRVNPTRNNPRWAPLRATLADQIIATLSEDAR